MTMMKKIKNVTVFRNVNLKKSFVAVVMYNSTHKHITVSIEIWIKLFIQPDVDLAYICVYVFVFIYIYKKYIYIYIYVYIYTIDVDLYTAAVSLLESSSVQLRSKEDLKGPDIYVSIYMSIYIK